MYLKIKRLQSLTTEKFTLVLPIAILCLALSGLFVYSSFYMPEYKDVAVETPWYTVENRYDYRAIVSEENPLWPVGTALTDNPAYFFAASPNLQTTFTLLARGNDVNLDVASHTSAVLSMKDSRTTYWSKEIAIAEHAGPLKSGTFQNSFNLNVRDLQNQLNSIQGGLGFQRGDPTIDIVTTTLLTGTVDGRPVDEVRKYLMPITLGQGHYAISGKLSNVETITTRDTRLTAIYPPVHQQYAAVISLIASVGLLIWVILARIRSSKTSADMLQELEREATHARYRDWMSRGRFDHSIKAHRIELGSLEDIISAAVDMNQRVIYDGDEKVYFFIHDSILYVHSPA